MAESNILNKLSLDILDHIMSHLEPSQLLHLSRVNTYLRAIIMTKKAKRIWRMARENVEMPECPPHMSEPFYVSLAEENICTGCCEEPAMHFLPKLEVRFCDSCFSQRTQRLYWKKNRDKGILDLIRRSHSQGYCLISEFKEVFAVYQNIRGDEAVLQKYVDHRREVVKNANLFDKTLKKWEVIKRNQEVSRIHTKLQQLGYGEQHLPSLLTWNKKDMEQWRHVIIEHRTDPVDGRWESELLPLLEVFIERAKERNLREYQVSRLRSRYQELSNHFRAFCAEVRHNYVFIPRFPELLKFPFINQLLAEDEYGIPVTTQRFQSVVDILEATIEDMSCLALKELARLVRTDMEEANLSPSSDDQVLLDMATSLFRCGYCTQFFDYANILRHKQGHVLNGVVIEYSVLQMKRLETNLSVVPRTSSIAGQVLDLLGLPRDSTHQAIKRYQSEDDKRLVCLCENPFFDNPATFSELVGHILGECRWYENQQAACIGKTRQSSYQPDGSDIQLINDHDETALPDLIVCLAPGQTFADIAPKSSTQAGDASRIPSAAKWRDCYLCLQLTGNKERIGGDKRYNAYHLKAKHGVQSD